MATSWLRDPDVYLGKEFSPRKEREKEIRVTQSFVIITPTICRLIRILSRFHLGIFLLSLSTCVYLYASDPAAVWLFDRDRYILHGRDNTLKYSYAYDNNNK